VSSVAKPSPSVFAAAAVAYAISGMAILASALFVLALVVGPARTGNPMRPGMFIVGVVLTGFFLCIAGFGVTVATGLMRLRNWARVSAIVWAVFMASMGALALAIGIVFFFRTPQAGSPPVRVFFLTIYAAFFTTGIWWLILFSRKTVEAEFSGLITRTHAPSLTAPPILESEDISRSGDPLPFKTLRGRAVLGRLLLAAIGSVIFVFVAARVLLGRKFNSNSPIFLGLAEVAFYGSLLLLLHVRMRKANLKPAVILGKRVDWKAVRRYWFLPILLGGTTLASLFLVFYPLSFVLAPFVDRWLLRPRAPLVSTGAGIYALGNVLNFFVMVVLAPFAEEIVFRGLLMTRWSVKWGTPRGILFSSLIFGLMHREVLGHAFFGYVMAVLYIETRSLYVPMIFHSINNAIVWLVTLKGPSPARAAHQTIAQFQSAWPIGLLAVLLFIPWAIWFLRRHYPKAIWKPPCFYS
jgi:membrane protease YdiL (CAAX protease family)